MPPKPILNTPTRVGLIGTYIPRRCGIATFSADLLAAMKEEAPETEFWSLAMNDIPEGYDYPPDVQFEIGQKVVADYRNAGDFLDMNGVDAVSLQHEFGIYGGKAGSNVVRLLQNLRIPVVTTLHTVLQEPDPDQREVIRQVSAASDRVVVMSERAKRILGRVYGVAPSRITVIPHGVPDMPFLDTSYHKDQFGLSGRKVILSFGLISRGKGYEYVVEALPKIVRTHPEAVFVIVGETHPGVKRFEGEAYIESVKSRAKELGVENHLVFREEFMDTKTLTEILSTADVCVTPYISREQIVSGVLSYALGAGKAIVSTPYWYAEEMLAEGRGRLVPFRDGGAIAREVIDLLSNDNERQAMRKQAYTFARNMIWSDVGAQYLRLFREVRQERAVRPRIYQARTLSATQLEPAAPRLDHLHVLSDDTGILQHARFAVPDRDHGYCTDDNARALIVALMAQSVVPEVTSLTPLAYRYLSFLQHAFNPETGRFRNFMSFDRRWQELVGSEDSHGRALWGLGQTVLDTQSKGMVGAAMILFEQALPAVFDLTSTRSWAFALIGLDAFLRRFPGASEAKRARLQLSDRLFRRLQNHAAPNWPWPEDIVTYANGVVPQALIAAGRETGRSDMVDAALKSLRWLVDMQTDAKGNFVPIGNDGWLKRGGIPARYDQQPTEAQHMVDALLEAHQVTGDSTWLEDARRCYEWFLGRNDVQQPVVDLATGGCRDGLGADGLNQNQGAESTLAWLHASLRFTIALGTAASETRTTADEFRRPAAHPASPAAERVVGATH
jgi:glycosyltransferase involved in cell wall biosynthesis